MPERNETPQQFFDRLLQEGGHLRPGRLDLFSKNARVEARQEALKDTEPQRAQRFIQCFKLYVRAGVFHQLWLETAPILEDEDASQRQGLLDQTKGWIAVYELHREFIGSSAQTSLVADPWVEQALNLLREQSWSCKVRCRIQTDDKGNTAVVELCIQDSRVLVPVGQE